MSTGVYSIPNCRTVGCVLCPALLEQYITLRDTVSYSPQPFPVILPVCKGGRQNY